MRWNPFASTKNPVDQARSEYLGKIPKIQTALEASIVNDLHKIGAQERATVDEYRRNKVFGGKKPEGGGGEDSELIVADDVQINQGATWQTILAIAVPALLALLGWAYLSRMPTQESQETTTPVEHTDSDTRYSLKMLEGE